MAPRMLLLTGMPAVGKTTIVSRLVQQLRNYGISVGGIYSIERRIEGKRAGFVMIDLMTGSRQDLAAQHGEGPKMGKYRVNLKALEEFAVKAIDQAMQYADVVIIDEVGPMELMSPGFRRAVERLEQSAKASVLVVHARLKDPLILNLKNKEYSELFEVTLQNRDELPAILKEKILKVLAIGK
ncbi:MAG: NTPase [Nitrososphaerota archaeon]